MKHTVKIEKGTILLQLEGDLIGEQSGIEIVDLVNNYINEGIVKLAVDLSNVRYMNSSGIGVLITLLTKLRNAGGEMAIINPSEQIKKLLIITKLNTIFRVYASGSEAIEGLL
jgi:anti-sigma B factor antagonist